MSEHTPGPWSNDDPVNVPLPNGKREDRRRIRCAGADRVVAEVRGGNLEADARLIAAAPDLLAACREALRWESEAEASLTPEERADPSSFANRLRAVIAAATGEGVQA